MTRTRWSYILLVVIATCGGANKGCQTTKTKEMEIHEADSWKPGIDQRQNRNYTIDNGASSDDVN